MELPEHAVRLRIYLGESDRWEHRPLYETLVLAAREQHIAGATVLRGPMGFGRSSRLHTTKILQLSTDLPIVVEMIDSAENIDRFLSHVQAMIDGRLATTEAVTVMRPRARS